MKNGVNVAGVSEIMHEIREDNSEGIFAYDTEAQWTGGDTLMAFVNAAHIGSVKSCRSFQWRVTLEKTAPVSDICAKEMVFTPEELALTGLGSCALLTMVKGATTRGRNIQSLRFLVQGKQYPATSDIPALLTDFDYRVEFDAESPEDNILFSEVLKKLSNHSPNHRTIVERNKISIADKSFKFEKLSDVEAEGDYDQLMVDLFWEYGFQLMVNYPDGVRYTRVDQPKQAGGIDKGANPQEILMASFASCLSRTFIALTKTNGLPLHGLKIRTTGHVDMRGMLGIDPEIPSKLQEITVHFDIDSPVDINGFNSIIEKAIQQSPVARLLIEPQRVNLHLHRNSAQIIEFVSEG